MSRVLLVEDDADLQAAMSLALSALGHTVTAVGDGPAAAEHALTGIEVIVLDVMLPGFDGFEVCRRVRHHSSVPIIMVTARGDPIDIVVGLECGADDYVTKPVEPRVLDARIKAVLRRTGDIAPTSDAIAPTPAAAHRIGTVLLDESAMQATRDGQPIPLTPTELRLLVEFAHHRGQALSRPVLLERVWSYGYAGDGRLVDACVQRLRTKIEADPAHPEWLVTVRGIGYRLERT